MRSMRARARLDGHVLPDSGTLRVMLSRWENGRHHPAPFYRRLIADSLEMSEADLGFGWKLTHWDDYLRSIDLGLRPRCPHLEIDNGENAAVGLAAQAQRFVSLVRHEA